MHKYIETKFHLNESWPFQSWNLYPTIFLLTRSHRRGDSCESGKVRWVLCRGHWPAPQGQSHVVPSTLALFIHLHNDRMTRPDDFLWFLLAAKFHESMISITL